MKPFLLSAVAIAAIAFGANMALTSIDRTASEKYQRQDVRLDPGQ